MHLKEGTLLQNGKYRIERKLGQGSYGITYLATMKSRVGGSLGNMEVSVSVAVKEFFVHDNDGREGSMVTYSKGSSLHEKYKKKFRTESEKLSRLSHPNIVKVLDSFESNNTYYYVMEYCGGGSLDSVIPKNKGLEEMDAIRYAIQIGEALRYMHGEKMLHLDLKPGNVVLREDGTAVLIDFGLSKEYDDVGNPETSTTIGQGTKGYAPIEQAYYNKENKTFPVTIDVYALGATMYKMLTGKTPPDASDILNKGFPKAELKRNGISDYIVDLVEKSMSPIVSDRLQSVDEFLDLLVKAEESEATLKECSGDRELKEKTLSDEEERKRKDEEEIKRRVEEELKRREEEKRREQEREQELERERRKEEEIKRRVEEELKRKAEEERKRKEAELTRQLSAKQINGHDYVDLGLPSGLKWATCNVGANRPEDYGDYYAWGETETKSRYDIDNCSTFGVRMKKFGVRMNKISGKARYDVARKKWGGSWRMPTKEELEELTKNCTWKSTKQNGVKGHKVTGPNGRSIFLPAAGCRYRLSLCHIGLGRYWSSTPDVDDGYAYYLYFSGGYVHDVNPDYRFNGLSVRPVSE